MNKNVFLLSILVLSFAIFNSSCDKEDDGEEMEVMEEMEVIANDSTFASFASWTLVATETGTENALLAGGAHGGNSETSVRDSYFKDNASVDGDEYPVGTLIAKHVSDSDDSSINAYFGMVKRGADFDAANNDWEYFILNADGSIASDPDTGNAQRGDFTFKACGACHAAASTDYLFSK